MLIYRDQADKPSPVGPDVRCFATCVPLNCYRSCHPETLRDGYRQIGTYAVRVVGGLIVSAWGRGCDEEWDAA